MDAARRGRWTRAGGLALCLCVGDTGLAASGCDDLGGLPANRAVLWPEVWQRLNDEAPCTQNCHTGSSPTAELDFGSRQISIYFLVGQPSSQDPDALRVDPGHPERSVLMQKIGCSEPDVGGPMPPPGGHLSIALQGLVYDWIAQGAFGEDPEDPIPRTYLFRDSMESERFVGPYSVATEVPPPPPPPPPPVDTPPPEETPHEPPDRRTECAARDGRPDSVLGGLRAPCR